MQLEVQMFQTTVFMQSDGTIKMDTIKPRLGKGLGSKGDMNKGKNFPLIKLKDGSFFDEFFGGTAYFDSRKKNHGKSKRY